VIYVPLHTSRRGGGEIDVCDQIVFKGIHPIRSRSAKADNNQINSFRAHQRTEK